MLVNFVFKLTLEDIFLSASLVVEEFTVVWVLPFPCC